jgi:hypothetical protein
MEKYKFYQFKNHHGGITVVAASTYGKKTVKGYAKCNANDDFDFEKGKELAAARCALKIAEKRNKRAAEKYMEASKELDAAMNRFAEMKTYFMDSVDQVDEAIEKVNELIEKY